MCTFHRLALPTWQPPSALLTPTLCLQALSVLKLCSMGLFSGDVLLASRIVFGAPSVLGMVLSKFFYSFT